MDSILELEQSEIDRMVEVLSENKDLFKKNAADLFEDAFYVLTSTGAKIEHFKVLRKLKAVSQTDDGVDNDGTNEEQQQALSQLFDIVLNIASQVYKHGISSQEEFQLVLNDLGLKGSKGAPVQEAFVTALVQRLSLTNASTEDASAAMTGAYSKKMPLNLQLADDNIQSSNPKLVDVEWQTLYQINSKNINKLMQPRFLITLTLLCQGEFRSGGAVETVAFSSKRNQLSIKRIKFECNFAELQNFHSKVK